MDELNNAVAINTALEHSTGVVIEPCGVAAIIAVGFAVVAFICIMRWTSTW